MAKVGIIMGSKSDYPVMEDAVNILKELGVDHEVNIVSAHRTPEKMMSYSKNAHSKEKNVILFETLIIWIFRKIIIALT